MRFYTKKHRYYGEIDLHTVFESSGKSSLLPTPVARRSLGEGGPGTP
jgi:hypothetical protein